MPNSKPLTLSAAVARQAQLSTREGEWTEPSVRATRIGGEVDGIQISVLVTVQDANAVAFRIQEQRASLMTMFLGWFKSLGRRQ